MQETARSPLLRAGRPLAKAERDVERFMKGMIRSWIKPLRRIERLMERTHDESARRLDDLIRINNWCVQDLAENTYVSEASGNYEKTLRGLCGICRPHVKLASTRCRAADGGTL